MVFPPDSVQLSTTIEVKVFPEDTRTSKYSPVEVKLVAATGSLENWEIVMPPMPVAVTVVPSFVAVAVPLWVEEEAEAELTAPLGAGGGVVEGDGVEGQEEAGP